MATRVIMPALEMAQDTGKLISWLKQPGEAVRKGEPLMEVETDKVTVEIEAPADGVLAGVIARPGDDVPVGEAIAWILAPGEALPDPAAMPPPGAVAPRPALPPDGAPSPAGGAQPSASPVARRVAREHGVNLAQVRADGRRIEKADVLAHLARAAAPSRRARPLASPLARRLAAEQGVDLASVPGSGPEGAVLAADLPAVPLPLAAPPLPEGEAVEIGALWRVMAERMTRSWTGAPHFYLTREVEASALLELRRRILPAAERRYGLKPTLSDLLVLLAAVALREHPRVNASWSGEGITLHPEINVALAVAVEAGLVAPVIHSADSLSVGQIAQRRAEIVERAREGKLRPADIAGGTFTLSNLGMYGVDAFNAILNPPQAAILAVGRIAERVVPVDGVPAVRPMLVLTLSCDHRAVDGARGAQFLGALARLIEEPWGVLA